MNFIKLWGGEVDLITEIPERIMGILIIYQRSNESVKAKAFTFQFGTAFTGYPLCGVH